MASVKKSLLVSTLAGTSFLCYCMGTYIRIIIHQKGVLRLSKVYTKEFVQRVDAVFNEILGYYEERDGNLDDEDRPAVKCPRCGEDTKFYGCVWNYNKHIHLYCEKCGCSIRQ